MIGKVIGAFVGDRLAKQTGGIGGASGAALGVVGSGDQGRLGQGRSEARKRAVPQGAALLLSGEQRVCISPNPFYGRSRDSPKKSDKIAPHPGALAQETTCQQSPITQSILR